MVEYPRIPGHEISATVEELGSGVEGLYVGEAVTAIPYTSCGECSSCRKGRPNACKYNQTLGVQREGAMTEFISLPREKVLPLKGLDQTSLALVEPLTVGFHAISRGEVQPEDRVVVFGCGMIGLGAVAGAVAKGAKVAAIDIAEDKLDKAMALGAEAGILSTDENLLSKVEEWTHGDFADVVIEAAGHPSSYRSSLEVAGFSAKVCCIGYAKEDVPLLTKLIVQKELDIRGSRNALPSDFEAVVNYLKETDFPMEAIVSERVSLDDSPSALATWSDNPSKITKLVVDISPHN